MKYLLFAIQPNHFHLYVLVQFVFREPMRDKTRCYIYSFSLEVPSLPSLFACKSKVSGFVKFRAKHIINIIPRNYFDSHF